MTAHSMARNSKKEAWRPLPEGWREIFLARLEDSQEAGRLLALENSHLLKVGKGAMMFLLNPQSAADEREKREKEIVNRLRHEEREVNERLRGHPRVFHDLASFLNCSFTRDIAEHRRIQSQLEMFEKIFNSRTAGAFENHYYLFGLREYLKDKCDLQATRCELATIVSAANRALARPEPKEPLDPDSLTRKLRRFEQNRPWLLEVEKLRLSAVQMIENLPT